jgi:Fe-S cluster assembly protein SufD
MRIDILKGANSGEILRVVGASEDKKELAKKLAEVGIPTKKSEKYRYFDIDSYTSKDLELKSTTKSSFKTGGSSLIIEDGEVVKAPDLGVAEVEIADSFDKFDRDHFDGLYYLNHLLSSKVITVKLKGETHLNINHIFNQEDSLINYRVILEVEPNSSIQIYETIESNSKNSQALSGYDILLERDANLKFYRNQTIQKDSSVAIFTNSYSLEENATFKLGTFDFLSSNSLTLFKSNLKRYSNFEATHLLYTTSDIKAGTVSEIAHIGENSKSKQVAKNILSDSSRGIFDALIKVKESGKGTSAHQNSKAILLDKGAYMASKPQLEIYIDELEASHGSTTGQLDEKALFYLRSRGIKKSEAIKMLILAFANEAIDSIDDEKIANHIYVDFEKAYYGSSDVECIKSCHECEDMILGDGNGES